MPCVCVCLYVCMCVCVCAFVYALRLFLFSLLVCLLACVACVCLLVSPFNPRARGSSRKRSTAVPATEPRSTSMIAGPVAAIPLACGRLELGLWRCPASSRAHRISIDKKSPHHSCTHSQTAARTSQHLPGPKHTASCISRHPSCPHNGG